MNEKFYSKRAARLKLGVSRARYEQLIEAGFLSEPFKLTRTSRPVHTETQLRRCEMNLTEIASREHLTRAKADRKPIKPLSEKLFQEIF